MSTAVSPEPVCCLGELELCPFELSPSAKAGLVVGGVAKLIFSCSPFQILLGKSKH